MGLQWSTTGQETVSNGVKILVYADSGIGKTALCATAPVPFIISAEKGLLSLRKKNIEKLWGVATPGIAYDIPSAIIDDMAGLQTVYEYFSKDPSAKQFKTICLDSISEVAEVVLNNAKRTAKDPRQAYGALLEQMQSLVRLFRDLPGFNVYMAAKMEPWKDEAAGMIKYGPSMPGSKLGPQLPYFFDEVLRLAVGQDPKSQQTYRYLQTQPDLRYVAKDRSGALDAMEMPHLTNVFNKIIA